MTTTPSNDGFPGKGLDAELRGDPIGANSTGKIVNIALGIVDINAYLLMFLEAF